MFNLLISSSSFAFKPKGRVFSKPLLTITKNSDRNTNSESLLIQTSDGAMIIGKVSGEVESVTTIGPKFQMSKLGNRKGIFQIINIVKKEKVGELKLTLEFHQKKNTYVPRKLSFTPYENFSGSLTREACESGLKTAVDEFENILDASNTAELITNLKRSEAIDSSCKSLPTSERELFYQGLATAINPPQDSPLFKTKGCLAQNSPHYTSAMKYMMNTIANGSSGIKFSCNTKLASSGSYQQKQDSDLISIRVPFETTRDGKKERLEYPDIAEILTHEIIHGATLIIDRLYQTIDQHKPIYCCLENDLTACQNQGKQDYKKSLDGLNSLPGLRDYFKEFEEPYSEYMHHKLKILVDSLIDEKAAFQTKNPECTDKNMSQTCIGKFTTALENFQKTWMASSCPDQKCKNISNFKVDLIAYTLIPPNPDGFGTPKNNPGRVENAVTPPPARIGEQPGKVESQGVNRPGKVETLPNQGGVLGGVDDLPNNPGKVDINNPSPGTNIQLPKNGTTPQAAQELSNIVAAAEIHEANSNGPLSARVSNSFQQMFKGDLEFADTAFKAVIPPASGNTTLGGKSVPSGPLDVASSTNNRMSYRYLPSPSSATPLRTTNISNTTLVAGSIGSTGFQTLPKPEQLKLLQQAAQGDRPHDSHVREVRSGAADLSNVGTPSARIPFGTQRGSSVSAVGGVDGNGGQGGTRTPASASAGGRGGGGAGGGSTPLGSAISPASSQESSGAASSSSPRRTASESPRTENARQRSVRKWEDLLKRGGLWTPTHERDEAFKGYLRSINVEIYRRDTKLIRTQESDVLKVFEINGQSQVVPRQRSEE